MVRDYESVNQSYLRPSYTEVSVVIFNKICSPEACILQHRNGSRGFVSLQSRRLAHRKPDAPPHPARFTLPCQTNTCLGRQQRKGWVVD
jgi:hypothetical protein